jgi:hypothetical protein
MSFYFTTIPDVSADTLTGGWLEPYGIRAVVNKDTVGLEANYGFFHVRQDRFGKGCALYGPFDPRSIIEAIRSEFKETAGEMRVRRFQTEREYRAWRGKSNPALSTADPDDDESF